MNDPRHPYERIAADLREKILAGELAPGARLPSEPALSKQYKVTRTTVRKAIAVLKSEGRVESRQGQGTIVRIKPYVRLHSAGANYRARRETGVTNYNAEAAAQGLKAEQKIREVVVVDAPPEISARLELSDDDERAIVRRLSFLLEGKPDQTCDSYYPYALANGTPLAVARKIRGGAHAVIEDPEGTIRRTIRRFVEDLEVRMPTPAEVRDLQIPTGVPVARVIRTAYDNDGQPVEVLDSVIPCDRHSFRYVIEVPSE